MSKAAKTALIINPWVTDFKLYDEWMHPLGLYFLISLLRHNSWDVQYINCLERSEDSKMKRFGTGTFSYTEIEKPQVYNNILRRYKRYGISKDDYGEQLNAAGQPDMIFIGSGMTYWLEGLMETVSMVEEHVPAVPIITGGISATLITKLLQKCIDRITVFPGSLPENIASFRKLHPALKETQIDSWQPSFTDAYPFMKKHYHGPLLTSFGCPLHCSYCASSHFQKKFQYRPHEVVIEEMIYLTDKGITDFAFYDDALLYRFEQNFLPFMEQIIKHDLPIRLHVPNGLHIRWLNQHVLETMQSCGFVTLRFGYESSHVKYQQDTNAKTCRNELAEKVSLIQSAGFTSDDVGIYVMAGLPEQTIEDVLEEISFVASLQVKVKPVFLSPVPHTKLFDYYTEMFPQLRTNPLLHNDTSFITRIPGWSYAAKEDVKGAARELNKKLQD